MRSVVVVLPASIWAAMPILRVRSMAYWRPGAFTGVASIVACIFKKSLLSSVLHLTAGFCASLALFSRAPDMNKNAPKTALGAIIEKTLLPAEMRKGLVG